MRFLHENGGECCLSYQVKVSEKESYIYVLCDPDTDEPRYVGWTVNVRKRLWDHVYEARKRQKITYKNNWVFSVLQRGKKPVVHVVDTIPPNVPWGDYERFWIARFRSEGADLTNATDGGEGVCGWTPTDEYREGCRARSMGRKHSDSSKETMRQRRQERALSGASISYEQLTVEVLRVYQETGVWSATTKAIQDHLGVKLGYRQVRKITSDAIASGLIKKPSRRKRTAHNALAKSTVQTIVQLRTQRLTYKEIADIVGCSPAVAERYSVKHGVSGRVAPGHVLYKQKKSSTSQYLGVYFDKESQKWRAYIRYRGKQVSVGRFNSEVEAALAYNAAAIDYYGDRANLNTIQAT